MSRKLASIQRILDLEPIPGADAIEKATVLGWEVVVKRGLYQVGDLVVFFEIDSFLPIEEQYEFLRKSSYRQVTLESSPEVLSEGFRIRTCRLRGQVSQGLCFPITELFHGEHFALEEGEDVSLALKVKKYDPYDPPGVQRAGKGQGYMPEGWREFPDFLPKTDERRIQTVRPDELNGLFDVTEKLDGSSMTIFVRDGEYGVCSRNRWLPWDDSTNFGRVARELDVVDQMRALAIAEGVPGVAVQGELIGPGIQKNKYGLTKHEFRVFNLLSINQDGTTTRLEPAVTRRIVKDELTMNPVPTLGEIHLSWGKGKDLIRMASTFVSAYPKCAIPEGLVFRKVDGSSSFKAINPEFLLKHGE